MMWEDQLGFVARHTGLPRSIAGALLLMVAAVQLSSTLMIAPTSRIPMLAVPVMIVSGSVVMSVIMQPFLFNQLSNTELLTLSLAQIGASGLIFAEAHFVAYPRRSPFAAHLSAAEAYKAAAIVPWIQLAARLLLTADLTLTFGLRIGFVEFAGIGAGIATTTYVLVLLSGVMVWLGFKTQACACIIALAAFTDAFFRYPFWEGGRDADHKRFHFFQAMTPVGGLLMLVALGPGRYSLDAHNKSN